MSWICHFLSERGCCTSPGHSASGRLVSLKHPSLLAFPRSSCRADTSKTVWKASPTELDSLLGDLRAASGEAGQAMARKENLLQKR